MQNPFDKYAVEYDRWYDENKFIFLSEVECIKKAIDFKTNDSLEIGVGTGRFAKALGIEYGIDISENALKIAQKRGIKTYKSNADNLPFENEKFGSVFIIFAVCFLKNPSKALKESVRVLRKKGKIIIAMINGNSDMGRYYKKKRKENIFYKKAKFYSPKTIINILKRTGIKKIETYQTLFTDPGLIKISKIIEKPKKGHDKGGVVVIRGEK
ncbi:MAG: methyltransferase domain-containing protein [Elusimicrobiota bacterium]